MNFLLALLLLAVFIATGMCDMHSYSTVLIQIIKSLARPLEGGAYPGARVP